MPAEKSCGVIVFTYINGVRYYVIVQQVDGHHGFPKGHVEGQESDIATALREVKEETGLVPTVINGFRYEDSYLLPHKEDTLKQVVYFVGEYNNQEIVPQVSEIMQIKLLKYADAYHILEYYSLKKALQLAEHFISGSEVRSKR